MVEQAAVPQVPSLARRALSVLRAWTTPASPSEYLELVNPLWTTRELLGSIVEIRPETPDSATIVLKPNRPWPGHEAGQWFRVGVDIHGVRHWRAFTLTSDSDHPAGLVALTIKRVEGGLMSTFLLDEAKPGTLLYLGEVQGDFTLTERPSDPLLFISAGSGVTPFFALLRHLERKGWIDDVVHVDCVRSEDDLMFASALRQLDEREPGYRLLPWFSKKDGRLEPGKLDEMVPDWRERMTYLSGPPEMIEAFKQHWKDAGLEDRFELERFQPKAGADVEAGQGGTIRFRVSDTEAEADGSTPILQAGEDAGLSLRFGCRMGICHTCVGKLAEGQVRNLSTGEVGGSPGDMIRICINCPEGHVEVEL